MSDESPAFCKALNLLQIALITKKRLFNVWRELHWKYKYQTLIANNLHLHNIPAKHKQLMVDLSRDVILCDGVMVTNESRL